MYTKYALNCNIIITTCEIAYENSMTNRHNFKIDLLGKIIMIGFVIVRFEEMHSYIKTNNPFICVTIVNLKVHRNYCRHSLGWSEFQNIIVFVLLYFSL